jgi:hypothetical protein
MPKVGGRRVILLLIWFIEKDTHTQGCDWRGSRFNRANSKRFRTFSILAFIIKRGKVSGHVRQLIDDYRDVMYPYTSMNLQENDKTKLKDYIRAAGYY